MALSRSNISCALRVSVFRRAAPYSVDMEQQNGYGTPHGHSEKWVPALVLIAVGTIFFLNNLHIFYIRDLFQYWPVILIACGIFKLVDSPDAHSRVGGGILVAIGGVLLAINLGYLAMGWGELWPLVLIGVGLLMLTSRLTGQSWCCGARYRPGRRLHQAAVFGGGKRVISDADFTGGKVDAVFSGFEIDLRGAAMVGDSIDLEINAVFGGVEVKVPLHWNVVIKGTGVFGAYVDNTRHPNPAEYPVIKQVVFRGGAVFGGVEIKN